MLMAKPPEQFACDHNYNLRSYPASLVLLLIAYAARVPLTCNCKCICHHSDIPSLIVQFVRKWACGMTMKKSKRAV